MATADVDAGRIRFIASASLRDRFATAAMGSMINLSFTSRSEQDKIAQIAYQMADAMLKERVKPPGEDQ